MRAQIIDIGHDGHRLGIGKVKKHLMFMKEEGMNSDLIMLNLTPA